MRNKIIVKSTLIAVAAALMLTAAACSGATAQAPQGRISPTWITAEVNGDEVSISEDEVNSDAMTHFEVQVEDQDLTFMAYVIGGQIQVRADVCVPCHSISFSLDGGDLICNACGTIFSSNDGRGISGPCKNYPKASVSYQIINGRIVMEMNDLQYAYDDTLQPG